ALQPYSPVQLLLQHLHRGGAQRQVDGPPSAQQHLQQTHSVRRPTGAGHGKDQIARGHGRCRRSGADIWRRGRPVPLLWGLSEEPEGPDGDSSQGALVTPFSEDFAGVRGAGGLTCPAVGWTRLNEATTRK